MSASLPAVPLALVVLAGPALAAPCQSVRHLEILATASGEAQRVCISPGQTTVFSFDTPLAPGAITLEGADGFTWVEPGTSTLKLIPSDKAQLGRELRVTVRFVDSAAPSSATFVLVAHAAEAASLVEVHRRTRSAESYQQELREKEEEARQLREENARLRMNKEGPGGLTGLLVSGSMDMGGVTAQNLTEAVMTASTGALQVRRLRSFRSTGRVAIELLLRSPKDAPAWTVAGATLIHEGKQGQGLKVLSLWQQAPTALEHNKRVIVEAESPGDANQGPYTLRLWDTEGQRAITVAHLTFS